MAARQNCAIGGDRRRPILIPTQIGRSGDAACLLRRVVFDILDDEPVRMAEAGFLADRRLLDRFKLLGAGFQEIGDDPGDVRHLEGQSSQLEAAAAVGIAGDNQHRKFWARNGRQPQAEFGIIETLNFLPGQQRLIKGARLVNLAGVDEYPDVGFNDHANAPWMRSDQPAARYCGSNGEPPDKNNNSTFVIIQTRFEKSDTG
ncbi:MAG TPA: hypothetical protein VGM09_30070 [Bradyrhizobium sp.]